MKVWEDFIYSYKKGLFNTCSQILYQLVDEQTYNGVHLPKEDWTAIYYDWIKIAHQMGVVIATRKDFLEFFDRVVKRTVEGPGNPIVNN